MIEKFSDLELEKVETEAEVSALLFEKLGISISEMKKALSSAVIASAYELTHEMTNIAPLGDYSNLLEDNDSMAEFLHTEAHKEEHWLLEQANVSDVQSTLLVFKFGNNAIDDGTVFKGFVYMSFQGKIKHAFAQTE